MHSKIILLTTILLAVHVNYISSVDFFLCQDDQTVFNKIRQYNFGILPVILVANNKQNPFPREQSVKSTVKYYDSIGIQTILIATANTCTATAQYLNKVEPKNIVYPSIFVLKDLFLVPKKFTNISNENVSQIFNMAKLWNTPTNVSNPTNVVLDGGRGRQTAGVGSSRSEFNTTTATRRDINTRYTGTARRPIILPRPTVSAQHFSQLGERSSYQPRPPSLTIMNNPPAGNIIRQSEATRPWLISSNQNPGQKRKHFSQPSDETRPWLQTNTQTFGQASQLPYQQPTNLLQTLTSIQPTSTTIPPAAPLTFSQLQSMYPSSSTRVSQDPPSSTGQSQQAHQSSPPNSVQFSSTDFLDFEFLEDGTIDFSKNE